MRHRYFVMLLIGLVGIPTIGVFLYLQGALWLHQVRQQDTHTALGVRDTLVLHLYDYQAALHNAHELDWQGVRYDISASHQVGDSVRVVGIQDHWEAELIRFLDEWIGGSSCRTATSSNTVHQQWLQWLLHWHYIPARMVGLMLIFQRYDDLKRSAWAAMQPVRTEAFWVVPVPPPEC
jgi:hypothetical protein